MVLSEDSWVGAISDSGLQRILSGPLLPNVQLLTHAAENNNVQVSIMEHREPDIARSPEVFDMPETMQSVSVPATPIPLGSVEDIIRSQRRRRHSLGTEEDSPPTLRLRRHVFLLEYGGYMPMYVQQRRNRLGIPITEAGQYKKRL